MNDVAPPPPGRGMSKRLSDCRTLQEAFETRELRDRIASTLPRHMDPDTLLRTFIQAASKTPLIYKCDLRQSIGAFMSLSYLGLVPGTVQNHAHLIPFAKRKYNRQTKVWEDDGYDLQIIIGYSGLVELAFRSGFVRDVATGVVLPGDFFDFERGTKRFLAHKPQIDGDHTSETPRCAWAMAKFVNEGEEFEVMPWAEIMTIRNRSQAFKTAVAAKERAEKDGRRVPSTWTEAPWVAHERQMARKTALRRLSGLLPKCPELQAGVNIDNAAEAGKKLDFGTIIDGTSTPWDGVPEQAEAASDEPADPGAAFTDRREQTVSRQTTAPTATREQPTETQQTKAPVDQAHGSVPSVEFEAYVINEFGEPEDEPFDDPVAYAKAIITRWRGMSIVDGDAFVSYNGDFIVEAKAASPEAADLLAALDSTTDDRSDPTIRPPVERGKANWAAYDKAMKDAAARLPQGLTAWLAWLEAQREVLTKEAPQANRIRAVTALRAQAVKIGAPLPGWVTEAIRPLAKREPDAGPDSEKQTGGDDAWADDVVAELELIGKMGPSREAKTAYSAMADSAAIKTKMSRLARENRPVFDRVDATFIRVAGLVGITLPGQTEDRPESPDEIPPAA